MHHGHVGQGHRRGRELGVLLGEDEDGRGDRARRLDARLLPEQARQHLPHARLGQRDDAGRRGGLGGSLLRAGVVRQAQGQRSGGQGEGWFHGKSS